MSYIKDIINQVIENNPGEPEFHQAVTEVMESLQVVIDKHPEYIKAGILERIVEPSARLFSGAVGGRPGKVRKPGLPRAVQQCYWSV